MVEYPQSGDRLVTIFGGSGFVGRHLVRAFARRGWRVRAAVRRPDLAGYLQPAGAVGQVHSVQANLRYPESIAAAVEGAEIVINAAGVMRAQGRQSYEAVHVFGSSEIARAARAVGARALIQVSGLGADPASGNAYIASKGRAETAAREAFPDTVVLRPSVVFGPEDVFFNRFGELARLSPLIPLFGGGQTRLQPVYVGDIAAAAVTAIEGQLKSGAVYELGGPQVMTVREAAEFVLRTTGRQCALVPLPFPLARLLAQTTEIASAVTLGKFPESLTTTRDQVDLLRNDNVVSDLALREGRTLAGLGIAPQGVEAIAPSYLVRFRRGGQYAHSRLA